MARLTYCSLDEITHQHWHSWVIDYLVDYTSYQVHSEGTRKYREILPQITLIPRPTEILVLIISSLSRSKNKDT